MIWTIVLAWLIHVLCCRHGQGSRLKYPLGRISPSISSSDTTLVVMKSLQKKGQGYVHPLPKGFRFHLNAIQWNNNRISSKPSFCRPVQCKVWCTCYSAVCLDIASSRKKNHCHLDRVSLVCLDQAGALGTGCLLALLWQTQLVWVVSRRDRV